MIKTVLNKSKYVLATSLFVGVLGATTFGFSNNAHATSNCDKVNIVYCGLTGNNEASYLSSFKSYYNSNKSGHVASPTVKKDYTDLKDVFAWAGASTTDVTGMNAANTEVGTLYKDGRIVVNGKTISTNAWVSARFTKGTGFVHVTNNVYARKTTTSFDNPSAKVIVHMVNGQMDFAVMIECGNAVKATPVKKDIPKPPVTPETPKPEVPKPEVTPVVAKTETPAELPKTGPASVVGLVSGITLAGASAHRIFMNRKNQ